MKKLKFALGNAKLNGNTAIFSLPAGHTCVGAKDCLAKVMRDTGKLVDGPETVFRCYAASSEVMFRNVRESRWNNLDILRGKSVAQMAELIHQSLPAKIQLCRIHQSGDFFNQNYFDAWLKVAERNPQIIFYAYTKALKFWIARVGQLPANFRITASKGGTYDSLIPLHNLKYVEVVFSVQEAKEKGLPLDHDDKLCWGQDKPFALLLHGTQKAQSPAAKALSALRADGVQGYTADYFKHYKKNA